MKVTKREKEIVRLLLEEGKTPKQISIIFGISHQAIYKKIKILRQKGLYFGRADRGLQKRLHEGGVTISQSPKNEGKNTIRLHNQQFWVKILFSSPAYQKLIQSKQYIKIEGDTICFWKDHIDIYLNRDFFGSTSDIAHSKSIPFLFSLLEFLEDRFGLLLLKEANSVIKEVRSHYSELDNELAIDMNERKEKLSIKAEEDNITWLDIDKSLSGNELEFRHPKTALEDTQKILPMFQAMRKGTLDPIETDKIARMALHTSATIVELLGLNVEKPNTQKTTKQTTLQEFQPERPDYFG